MQSEREDIIEEVFHFLKSDFGFHGPEKFNVAYENHLMYSNDRFKIDACDEGYLPSISIKDYKGNYVYLPDNWFKPKGIQEEIWKDYRKPRNLKWMSKIDQTTLTTSLFPLAKETIENSEDSFSGKGEKILAIYLILTSDTLKRHMDEIPSLFENSILKKIKNYLQQ